MLAYIKGTLVYKDADHAIIEASGLGYELSMPIHALASLPAIGSTAQVYTYLHVKEDGVSLFGFSDPAQKALFCQLISVSGIGPRIAISALSAFKPEDLISSISAGDIKAISTIPGIGKKTAQRLVLELQGILAQEESSAPANAAATEPLREASAALASMGFSSDEVNTALRGCTEQDTSGIIRYALKHMGGAA